MHGLQRSISNFRIRTGVEQSRFSVRLYNYRHRRHFAVGEFYEYYEWLRFENTVNVLRVVLNREGYYVFRMFQTCNEERIE